MVTGCSLTSALRHQEGETPRARHGKNDRQKEHFVAHNTQKRCIKKGCDGIRDRFQRDPVHLDSQHKIGWTDEKCIEMDKLAQDDHSYCLSSEECERYQKNWYLTEQNRQKCTDETPIRLPRSSRNYEPSPPRIWRRATWSNPFSSIPKVAFVFFFFQYLMVTVE